MNKMTFPRDEGSHDYNIEWWYFNGHLESASDKYGFCLTIFKAKINFAYPKNHFLNLLPIKYVYNIHFSLADKTHSRFYFLTKNFLGIPWLTYADDKKLNVKVLNTYMKSDPNGQVKIFCKLNNISLDLTLNNLKGYLIHGDGGLADFHIGGLSYYYSQPKLRAQGVLSIGEKSCPVSGTAWMDHQWGDWRPYNLLWYWASIQLNNNFQIMPFCIFDRNKNKLRSWISVKYPDGKQKIISSNIRIQESRYWTSPVSKIKYPNELFLEFSDGKKEYRLQISALSKNNEIRNKRVYYWEGPSLAKGFIGKEKVYGDSYMEIVGGYR